jgi:hypothetical protein
MLSKEIEVKIRGRYRVEIFFDLGEERVRMLRSNECA